MPSSLWIGTLVCHVYHFQMRFHVIHVFGFGLEALCFLYSIYNVCHFVIPFIAEAGDKYLVKTYPTL